MNPFDTSAHRIQRGGALIYVLIAVGLLAALTAAFMAPSSQQGQTQNAFKLVSELGNQVNLIQAAIQECVLTYPGGDNTINTSGGGSDPDAVAPYPIKPNSTHLTSPDANRQVKNLRCPGNPGNNPDHADIFAAATGKFLPPPPALFGDWQYYNGRDGVFVWIETTKSDTFLANALSKLEEEYAQCEADVIDASGGSPVALETGTATVNCTGGARCFRYWLVRSGAGAPACP